MRTTSNLDDSLLEELRRRGARERKSIGEVASEALARGLAENEPSPAPPEWTCRDLGEPYVDIEDKEALHTVRRTCPEPRRPSPAGCARGPSRRRESA